MPLHLGHLVAVHIRHRSMQNACRHKAFSRHVLSVVREMLVRPGSRFGVQRIVFCDERLAISTPSGTVSACVIPRYEAMAAGDAA